MKELHVQLPETLAAELSGLVEHGWIASEEEIARLALAEFVSRHRFHLEEKFQREDIAWALQLRLQP